MLFMKRVTYVNILLLAVIFAVAVQQQTYAAQCPCDIYAAGGTPCVAAHSTVRALYDSYNGPLYQVRRTSDNQTKDISVLTTGGFANAAEQDVFLNGQPGTISKIYDQSPNKNDLVKASKGGFLNNGGLEADATVAKITVNGFKVYGVYTTSSWDNDVGAVGYRNNATKGVVTGNDAEGVYMVCSGKHYNEWCCFDYGNAQTNNTAKGPATMESVYFGDSKQWGYGSGSGPWVMNDCEFGIQAGVDPNGKLGVWMGNTTIVADYVTGIVKSDTSNIYAIRGGDAVKDTLKTMYRGRQAPGYFPKKLEGAIILGIGGDNSHTGEGTFFEGAMTRGMPSDATENALQANIITAGYGRTTTSMRNGATTSDVTPASGFKVCYNPSNGSAVIGYTLQGARRVSVQIVDQRGRRIVAVVDGVIPAGRHEAVWNTKGVSAGVYVWRIMVDGMEGWAGKIMVGK
jgi:non-reducing end alpha-L-arabinofuranosidase